MQLKPFMSGLKVSDKSYLLGFLYDPRARAGYGRRYYRALALPGNT
jgi:hypothetical protein